MEDTTRLSQVEEVSRVHQAEIVALQRGQVEANSKLTDTQWRLGVVET